MKTDKLSDVLNEYIKLQLSKKALNVDDFLNYFHTKQKDYILNKDKKRVTFFYGGRRGGKTRGNVALIVYTDQFIAPSSHGRIVYASSTIEHAKDLVWVVLERYNQKLNLGWKFDNRRNKITTKSNVIVMRGLRDLASANKDMGTPIKLCIIEEPQTIKEKILMHYDYNVITWAMADFGNLGRLCYTGNPPHYAYSFLEKEYNNPNNQKIHVNIFDNPKFSKEQAVNFINEERRRRGLEVGKEDARFLREVYGDWIPADDTDIIFKVKDSNYYKELPVSDSYESVMGVDIGHTDCDAIIIACYSLNTGIIYLDYEEKKNKQDITALAKKILTVSDMYKIQNTVIDTGGLGKKIAVELENRYGIPIIPADKQNKMTYVELLRAHINNNLFKFRAGSELANEMNQIIYNEDKTKIDDKSGYHSDLLDAVIYAFRYIYNYILLPGPQKQKSYKEKRIQDIIKHNIKQKQEERKSFERLYGKGSYISKEDMKNLYKI